MPRALIEQVFVNGNGDGGIDGIGLGAMDDGAALRLGDQWLVITTDSHVIHPLFFPGGDIGRLAVAGTVNDLAVMGATEVLALTCAVIIEEGFARADLERIQASMRATCAEAGAVVVTGDTKVMGKGEIDGLVLNTTGVPSPAASSGCGCARDRILRPERSATRPRRTGGAPRTGTLGG
jgi:hydrogenase expression/formation protein HypE